MVGNTPTSSAVACFCNLNACRGTVIGGADGRKVGFSLSDCCRGSYAFVFRRFEHHQTAVCSVACDASSNRGGLGFRHVQIAKRWVSLSAQKRDRLLDSLERPGSGIPRTVRFASLLTGRRLQLGSNRQRWPWQKSSSCWPKMTRLK